jgi:hypothetical protein
MVITTDRRLDRLLAFERDLARMEGHRDGIREGIRHGIATAQLVEAVIPRRPRGKKDRKVSP